VRSGATRSTPAETSTPVARSVPIEFEFDNQFLTLSLEFIELRPHFLVEASSCQLPSRLSVVGHQAQKPSSIHQIDSK
jgi:hypothetical protein